MLVTPAIILRKLETKEHDKFLELLTPQFGRIDVVARGTRKIESKLNPHLNLLNILEVGFVQGPANKVLVLADTKEKFEASKVEQYEAAFEIIRLLEKLTWAELPEPKTFVLAEEGLKQIRLYPDFCGQITIKFKIKLLEILGYKPELEKCIHCHKRDFVKKTFNYTQGGLTCKDCLGPYEAIDIKEESFWKTTNYLLNDFAWLEPKLSAEDINQQTRFIDNLFNHFVDDRQKNVAFI
ncbi:DNA repair protein RecO [Candidatus Parcubacteria bacterium]|nr:MAG: DNA repair protein RecO [Candidatus Parcubacteria bacterium]